MRIPLIDLKSQYESLSEEIHAAVRAVLESGRYIQGTHVKALEEEIADYCGTKYAVGVASGTDALILSLDAYGIGPGDEVITTPYSFFATAEAVFRLGATPVFVDIDEHTYNMDTARIEEKITSRTKAILPVHLFGHMALMDEIMAISQRHNLVVIEDACQAIGASGQGRKAGSVGHAGCFSFFPTKNLGCYGDGGMITTNDKEFAERVKVLRAHGSRKKYFNEIVGYNSRLDEMQAAILRVKLKYLDQWNEARRKKARQYNELLRGLAVKTPVELAGAQHIYHLYIVRHKARDEIIAALKIAGVDCGVYYPVPLHLQDAYKHCGAPTLPVVEAVSRETFALPLYPEMSDNQLDFVVKSLSEALTSILI
ncbi:MAG: DegT/DnrJ/EryC1/StrS family aminotransferase [Desulfotomaculaceae bacterium]|nr:DegT/DnrJ/EryC1/StrS family aminotransferase [Desulfotomaculaceae bacterium]